MISGSCRQSAQPASHPPGVGPRCRRLGAQIGVTRWEVDPSIDGGGGRERTDGLFEWAGPIQLPEE